MRPFYLHHVANFRKFLTPSYAEGNAKIAEFLGKIANNCLAITPFEAVRAPSHSLILAAHHLVLISTLAIHPTQNIVEPLLHAIAHRLIGVFRFHPLAAGMAIDVI